MTIVVVKKKLLSIKRQIKDVLKEKANESYKNLSEKEKRGEKSIQNTDTKK